MHRDSARPTFRLMRIEAENARRRDDSTDVLIEQLSAHEDYYPGISKWIQAKVLPGLRSGERVGYVGLEDEHPILAAVLKRGARTKFCHLSIDEAFKSNRYGSLLFSLMAAEVRHSASDIHFTLPEGLWERERAFFESFGFKDAELARQQYRLFENELHCSAPFDRVWSHVLSGLPRLLTAASISGYGFNDGVVLSIREPHARAIMEGRKSVEIRRRFSEKWRGCRASIYATGPTAALLGEVTIEHVVRGSPTDIWEQFGETVGCSFEGYSDYVGERDEVFALQLAHPRPYAAPLPLSQLSHLISENLNPPQSYCTSAGSEAWSQALTAAALLHRRWTSPSIESHPVTPDTNEPVEQFALEL